MGPIPQLLGLLLSTLFVYGLCCLCARLLQRLLRLRAVFWRLALPWALFQAYLVAGLFRWGGLPAPAAGLLRLLALTGGLSAALGLLTLLRHRREPWRLAALFGAWGLPWLIAIVWSTL